MESIVTLYSAVRGNSAIPSWVQKDILLGVLTQDNSEYSASTIISGLSALRLFEGETELASLFNVTSDVTERGKRFVEGTSFDKYGFSCWEQWIIETDNNNNNVTNTNEDTNMNSNDKIYTAFWTMDNSRFDPETDDVIDSTDFANEEFTGATTWNIRGQQVFFEAFESLNEVEALHRSLNKFGTGEVHLVVDSNGKLIKARHITSFETGGSFTTFKQTRVIFTDPTTDMSPLDNKVPYYSGGENESQWVQCPSCYDPTWLVVSEDGGHDTLGCGYCGLAAFDGDIMDMPTMANVVDPGCQFCGDATYCATCAMDNATKRSIKEFIQHHHQYGSTHTEDYEPIAAIGDDDMDDPFAS